MPSNSDTDTGRTATFPPIEKGDAKVERFGRDVECEHRDVLDDGSLEPCAIEAEFAMTTADHGAWTRTRYCSIHIWNALKAYIERGGGGAE